MKRVRTPRKDPVAIAREWIRKKTDPPGFKEDTYGDKGRGVKTLYKRRQGDFLLQYIGPLVSKEEGERRETKESSGYRFFFSHNGNQFCVDATKETDFLGRLINHGSQSGQNSVMKCIDGHLCLFSTRDIEIGEEILYDYGLKKSQLPWKQVLNCEVILF
ncbi:N-lysine methyltransferase KMT5A-like [Pecten maximus]|uniref:N-lysine methyltransferase KMT5A-like n=1 Tax=Pecten maximus TaxID=6579 RepID=UPI001458F9F8|nr:N-lysine methyltransferase KMT5A-like [Pecten maximus]